MRDVPWPPRPRRRSPSPPPSAATPAGAPSRAETVFAVIAVFLTGTQATPMLLGGDEAGGARPVAVHAVFLSVYCVTFLLMLRTPRVFAAFLFGTPLLAITVLWPFLSIAWSVDPAASIQRGVALVGSSLLGVHLARRFPPPLLVRVLGAGFMLAALGSAVMIFAVPALGRMTSENWVGAWRGLYFHKNSLGSAMAAGAVILVFAVREARGAGRFVFAAGLAAAVVLLAGSRSTTALLAFVAMIGVMLWARSVRKTPTTAWLFTLLAAGMILIAALPLLSAAGFRAAMQLLGKNAELSGRLPLWELVLQAVSLRPWLGYGYEAFWNPDAPLVRLIAQSLRYTPFYSHNGVLETLLNGGVVLLAPVLLLYVATLIRSYLFMRAAPREPTAALPLVFCVFFVFANFSESKILLRNDLVWSLFVGFSFLTARAVRLRFRAPVFATRRTAAAPGGAR